MHLHLDWLRAGGIARISVALVGLAFAIGAVLSVLMAIVSLLVTVIVTAALLLFVLGTAAALVWAGVHLGTTINGRPVRERESLATLKERYVEGTLTEAEFERRVAVVLSSEDTTGGEINAASMTERTG